MTLAFIMLSGIAVASLSGCATNSNATAKGASNVTVTLTGTPNGTTTIPANGNRQSRKVLQLYSQRAVELTARSFELAEPAPPSLQIHYRTEQNMKDFFSRRAFGRVLGVTAAAAASPSFALESTLPVAAGSHFPAGFLWGSATASYQVEGSVHEAGRGPLHLGHLFAYPG